MISRFCRALITPVLLGASLLGSTSSIVWAAGFQIFEIGVNGQGVAHAGMATRADGPETVHFNPAGMVYLSGNQWSFGLSRHFVKASFTGRGEYSSATGPLDGVGFENSAQGSDGGDVSLPAPGFYAVFHLPKDVSFGLGVNTLFGLSTDYGQDWAGRYLAIESSLKTINFNPAFAVRLNDKLSLAAGVNALYAESKLTQALDLGLLLAPIGETPGLLANDGLTTVKGDAWAYGLNLGLIFEPVLGTRLGISYRSEQQLDIDGTVEFDTGRYPAATFGPVLAPSAATSEISLPSWATFSFYRELTPQWTVMFDATWTDWSVIDELRIHFPDAPSRPDTVLPTNWKDSWRFSLGVVHKISSTWTLRAGIAHEETPVPDPMNYTPRIPAGDGLSLAFGASYNWNPKITIDFAYTYIAIDALPINRTEIAHRLIGDYDGSVDIIGVQLRYMLE